MSREVTPSWSYSYAHLVDGGLRLDMQLPYFTRLETDGARVQIRNEKTTKTAPATITVNTLGVHLEAEFPPAKLRKGAWNVLLSPQAGAPFDDMNARVFVADPNPISLLVGAAPVSEIPNPVHTRKRRRKVMHRLGLMADRAVLELPPGQAIRVRESLRTAARKGMSLVPK